MIEHLAPVLYKRALDIEVPNGDGPHSIKLDVPGWAFPILFVDLLIAIPIYIFIEYTLAHLYPIFAIVEDENPPAYEPVALSDDPNEHSAHGSKPTQGHPKTVTSSLRAVHRLLRSVGGFKANFRGLGCAIAQAFLTNLLMGIFSGMFGGPFTPIATLLASLTLVQYSAAWVHIVISEPSPLHFWQRLPPFKRAFEATWKAVTLNWFSVEIVRWVPVFLAAAMNLDIPSFDQDNAKALTPVFATKLTAIGVITLLCSILLVVPAQIVLVRVQSSLLPVEENAVIPFDRTFQGKVEPAIVGGLGYATVSDAWSTFSKAGWRRLLVLYVKIFAIATGVYFAAVAVLMAQMFVVMKHSEVIDN